MTISLGSFFRGLLVLSVVTLAACTRNGEQVFPNELKAVQSQECEILQPGWQLLEDLSIRSASDPAYSGLTLSEPFHPFTYEYTLEVGHFIDALTLLPTQAFSGAERDIRTLDSSITYYDESEGEEVNVTLDFRTSTDPITIPKEGLTIEIVMAAAIDNSAVSFRNCTEEEQRLEVVDYSQGYEITIQRAETLSTYSVTNDSLADDTVLEPSVLGDNLLDNDDELGHSVAIYGDTMVIGIPGDDNGEATLRGILEVNDTNRTTLLTAYGDDSTPLNDNGVALVYRRADQGVWSLSYILRPEFPDVGDQFGYAVAINDEFIAISAPYEDSISVSVNGVEDNNLAPDSGAVHVYRYDDTSVQKSAYIKASSQVSGIDGYYDGFGQSLMLLEDVLMVGAPEADASAGRAAGKVYAYTFSGTDWNYSYNLQPENLRDGDRFGASLAHFDTWLLIGAPSDDVLRRGILGVAVLDNFGDEPDDFSLVDSGATYLFQRSEFGYNLRNYLKADNADAGDAFGFALSGSENEFVIGAPREDGSGYGLNRDMATNNLPESGAAYRYEYFPALSSWGMTDYFKSPEPQANGTYGSAVVTDARKILIGAPEEVYQVSLDTPILTETELENSGSAYLYYRNEDEIRYDSSFVLSDSEKAANERASASIAMFDQFILLGAPGAANDQLDAVGGNVVSLLEGSGAVLVME